MSQDRLAMRATMSRNIRLLIEYDGTPYVGWQLQEGQASIQGELEAALFKITGEANPQLMVAGRTDAGVHAYGQVANFRSNSVLEARRFTPALNHHLPDSIRIHRAEDAPPDFDARQAARSKHYRYRVYRGPHAPALDRRRAWHIRNPIDVDAMRRAAAALVGELDFESFRSVHCDAAHAIRRMHSITVSTAPRPPVGEFVDIVFHANAFCRHMCRILAGTLVEVGTGRRPVADVARVLASQDRTQGGVTAPPWGLTLLEVLYA